MCLFNTNATDKDRFQKWPKSQGQISVKTLSQGMLTYIIWENHYCKRLEVE